MQKIVGPDGDGPAGMCPSTMHILNFPFDDNKPALYIERFDKNENLGTVYNINDPRNQDLCLL
jgi:hypothetical protein